jgi:hypothetical protein
MKLSTSNLLKSLSNEDLVRVYEAGRIKEFCYALSLDLQIINNEKNLTYQT